MRTLAEVMAVLTEQNPRVAKVRIPKGAPVEDAFEYVNKSTGSKFGAEDNFYRVSFNGQVIWARATAGNDQGDDEVYIEDAP